jgi:UDP-glucose 4-epimerase
MLNNEILKEKYNNKTILITGSSGFIGTQLLEFLKNCHCNIIRLSNRKLAASSTNIAKISDVQGDLCSTSTWASCISKCDIIFHLAGETSIYNAEQNPIGSLNANVTPMLAMIQAALQLKESPFIVFAGSATEVGITKEPLVDESNIDNPITIYDMHKKYAEQQLQHYIQNKKLKGTSLRLANVYGPGANVGRQDRGILRKMATLALTQKKVNIYGDGNHIRDYIYIDDVIKAFLLAPCYESNVSGNFYYIGSGKGHTIKETFTLVAELAENLIQQKVSINYSSWPDNMSKIEFRNFIANISKFNTDTNWNPEVSLIDGIKYTMEEIYKKLKQDNGIMK